MAAKKKTTTRKAGEGGRKPRARGSAGGGTGKHLVIVESPAKAKTINKYLGPDYTVMASVGHVRDLPSKNPKGVKAPVPGVDLEDGFRPTYDIIPGKKKTVTDLRRAAKEASDIWLATDLDREGEAIAWHLTEALGVDPTTAKRVVFNAITKAEIERAFSQPRKIDLDKVNAQQARRILDRIVGYQVSPLLWKKVAGGLSAGRVQSVALRVVVEREREIDAFIPEEYWKITGLFATDPAKTQALERDWRAWLSAAPDDKARTQKDRLAWLSDHKCLHAELVEFDGKAFETDNRDTALDIAERLGFELDHDEKIEDLKAKGPAKHRVTFFGKVGKGRPEFRIRSIETKRTTVKPSAPFITSTLQQAAASQMSFTTSRTMRIAQQLYEGVEIRGSGAVGLITYMRTDSTHLSNEAIDDARGFIETKFGRQYLPEKPQRYSSSNKAAQEAHEAIRPTDVTLAPRDVRSSLSDEQFKLYDLIWKRFVACQMLPAQWDATTVLIETHGSGAPAAVFKTTGRKLVFDGFYKVTGVPSGQDLILPALAERQAVVPFEVDPAQHFTSPPPRYSEASLVKKLEAEGIGRPSTYAAIIQVIQNRKYVEKVAGRLHATDLGMVVTDKLVEAFPRIMDVGYTREMEAELDAVEEQHHDWVAMLEKFYGPFKKNLDEAHENLSHAKAETEPAPHKCPDCGGATVYRFGRNGRFLSCANYPECKHAAPIDREGNPVKDELTDILCPICGKGMTRRKGRFGTFLGCENYPQCKGIVNLDARKGTIKLPKAPPLTVEEPCPKCSEKLNLRRSKRGPWLSCSKYPKCRGRLAWSKLDEAKQEAFEKALAEHEKLHPLPKVRTTDGRVIQEDGQYVPKVLTAATDASDDLAIETEQEVGSDAA